MTTRRSIRSPLRCQDGSVAVEFALVGLVFIMTIIGIIEVGRGLNLRNQLSHAADFGAREALLKPGASASDLEGVVKSAFHAGSSPQLTVTIGVESVDDIQFRTISATYPFASVLPILGKDTITLTVSRRTPLL